MNKKKIQSKGPLLSVIVPIFNEAVCLETSLTSIRGYMKQTDHPFEMVIVDDGSTDDTWDILRKLGSEWKELRAVRLSRNFGKESSLAAGMKFGRGDAIIIMDGDLQHPPKLLPEMVRLWKDEGYDVVEGIKEARKCVSWPRRITAALFYRIMNAMSGYSLSESSDFKLLDRKVVEAHNRLPEHSRFFRGIVTWLGFKRQIFYYSVPDRKYGNSRWSFLQRFRLAINAITTFSSLPLHFVTILGIATLFVSMLLFVDTLYVKWSGQAVEGFTTVIVLLLFIGSILMVSLGIIGEYIARIYDEVKGRPSYLIAETFPDDYLNKK